MWRHSLFFLSLTFEEHAMLQHRTIALLLLPIIMGCNTDRSINYDELISIKYVKGEELPYTGSSIKKYENGKNWRLDANWAIFYARVISTCLHFNIFIELLKCKIFLELRTEDIIFDLFRWIWNLWELTLWTFTQLKSEFYNKMFL